MFANTPPPTASVLFSFVESTVELVLSVSVVLTEPSTGGALASAFSLGDFQISEKNVKNISFAGKRVVQQTIKESLPEDFGTASFQKDKAGQVDLIVERKYLNSTIGTLLNVLLKKAEAKDKQSNVSIDKSIQSAS